MKTLRNLLLSLCLSIFSSLLLAVFHNILITPQDQLIYAQKNNLASTEADAYNMRAVSEKYIDSEMKKLGIDLYTEEKPNRTKRSKSTIENSVEDSELRKCTQIVAKALKALPKEHTAGLKRLTLSFDPLARRGMAGGDQMIMRCTGMSEEELMAVVVHEMGHVVDTGTNLIGRASSGKTRFYDGKIPIYKNDPSARFYDLSFHDHNTADEHAKELDFVSGYSMTDPFEDFAETYAYYVLHGDAFRRLAKTNQVLAKKYEFMKESVFNSREYGRVAEQVNYFTRPYDVTVLKYEKKEFINI